MMGSAIRKPRIQPGNGSENADSMIEGRTIEMAMGFGLDGPWASTSARSPSALV